jgi:hypothetical protein
MTDETSYHAARLRADEAKERFMESVQAAKARVAPARLKQDAKDKISGAARNSVAKVKATARERPAVAAAWGAALLLFFARRPVAALFRRLYVRFGNPQPDSMENDHG